MSTPEQPDTPPLTRRQIREIRNTGATPIIGMPVEAYPEHAGDDTNGRAPDPQPPAAPSAPRPRAATPVVVPPAPAPDASVDLGVSPLTRRQARQQERIRTASVPVITPEFAARFAEESAAAEARQQPVEAAQPVPAAQPTEPAAAQPEVDEQPIPLITTEESQDADTERPVVNADFGADLLAGEPPRADLPGSFDELITRSSGSAGSVATPNALILSQVPSAGPLTGPIASTGEVLITGSYDLPEGLGSTGHAAGTADGKEVDAVLVDGELPAHSSPTPISASAAISTVKTDGEIIRPPAPEKGGRLMLALAITAGALALALVGVLILAFVTGAFS